MSLFKIMPHPMIGTIYHDDAEYLKVVKLRLKLEKRLPKHQQEDYNVFIIATGGQLQAEVNDNWREPVQFGDLFQVGGEQSFSLLGQDEENPFLYFIVPKTQDIEAKVIPRNLLGCCYRDDLIQFTRYQLTPEEASLSLNGPGDQYIVLCYAGEVGVKMIEPAKDHIYRLMQGDLLHFDGSQTIKILRKDSDALLFVICLRLA